MIAERALGKARRRGGVRRLCDAALPFLADENVRGVAAYVAKKIGEPDLKREVTRVLTESKERGRASRISRLSMGLGPLMIRLRRTCDPALTDLYFASIWRLVDSNRPSWIPLLVELAICFRRNGLSRVPHSRLIEEGFVDPNVGLSKASAVRLGRSFVGHLACWWEVPYLERLAIFGYLYLFYTGSGQHSHAESVRHRCEELIGSFELDALLQEEDASTVRNAYRRQVLGGAALGMFPQAFYKHDPLWGALAWSDSMGDVASTPYTLIADHIQQMSVQLSQPNCICISPRFFRDGVSDR